MYQMSLSDFEFGPKVKTWACDNTEKKSLFEQEHAAKRWNNPKTPNIFNLSIFVCPVSRKCWISLVNLWFQILPNTRQRSDKWTDELLKLLINLQLVKYVSACFEFRDKLLAR